MSMNQHVIVQPNFSMECFDISNGILGIKNTPKRPIHQLLLKFRYKFQKIFFFPFQSDDCCWTIWICAHLFTNYLSILITGQNETWWIVRRATNKQQKL